MGLGYNPNSRDGRGGRAERRAGGEEGEQGAGEVLVQVGRQVQVQVQGAGWYTNYFDSPA